MNDYEKTDMKELMEEVWKKLLKEREETPIACWKELINYEDLTDDKVYLVRDSRQKNMSPIVALWVEEFKEFIDIRGFHSYGLHVDEYMEIPE
jgi:hypothetical protein